MAYIPYLLYFPRTDFSFSYFSSYFSKSLPWIAFAGIAAVPLWITIRKLQKALNNQCKESGVAMSPTSMLR